MENQKLNAAMSKDIRDTGPLNSSAVLYPFGEALRYRSSVERMHEEVYSVIPVLNELANTSVRLSNKLSQESRNALFFEDSSTDPAIRVLKVEVGMVKRDQMERTVPDMHYLAGQQPIPHQSFDTADKDEWLKNG